MMNTSTYPVAVQHQIEIPPRMIHWQFNMHAGSCDACGQRVWLYHKLPEKIHKGNEHFVKFLF